MGYWQTRFEQLEKKTFQITKQNSADIQKALIAAERSIKKDINNWIVRFAKNNEVSIVEARKMLNNDELKEFKWDVKEFIKYGEENALNQEYMKELENASARFHISRLEAIELSIRNEFEKAYKIQDDKIRQNVLETYDDRYYRTCYEVQSKFGIGFDVSGVDTDKVKKLISKPWASDNKTFSDRVWTKKNEMIDTLRSQLIRTCATGGNIQDAVNSMMSFVSKDVKNARYAATRLLQTETAFFSSVSEKKALKDLDVEQYEILATLDSKTSPICQEMDGQVFKLSEYEIGATAPPFHVNCRSTTCPHFDDEYGERVARDRAGNTYMVPSDMTYKEWKEKQKNDTNTILKDNEKVKTVKNDVYNEKLKSIIGEEHYQNIRKLVEEAPSFIRDFWNQNEQYINVLDIDSDKIESYDPKNKGISFKLTSISKDNDFDGSKAYQVFFHEAGHNIDYALYNKIYNDDQNRLESYSSSNNTFSKNIKDDIDNIRQNKMAEMKQVLKESGLKGLFDKGYIEKSIYSIYKDKEDSFKIRSYHVDDAIKSELKKLGTENTKNLSDIIGGATNNALKLNTGHSDGYWKDKSNLNKEAFAEMLETAIANPQQYQIFKKYLPNATEEFEKMIKNLTNKSLKNDENDGKINKFINNINNAKTIEEINSIATEHFVNKEGCNISEVKLDGIDIDIAKEVVIKADDLTDRFKTTLVGIKSDDLDFGTNGVTRITEASVRKCINLKDSKYLQSNISLSKRLHSDKQNIEQWYLRNKSSQEPFLVVVNEKNKYISTFVHEFGHSILPGKANEILEKDGCTINQVFFECKRLKEKYEDKRIELAKSLIKARRENNKEAEKKALTDIRNYEVSRYAYETLGEFIAECFEDFELSDKPKEISKKLHDILVKEFGK